MKNYPEVISSHADIVIDSISDKNHNCNLINFNVTQLKWLLLKSKKLELKRLKISFLEQSTAMRDVSLSEENSKHH